MLKKTSRIGLILLALILVSSFVFTGCKKGLKGARILIAEYSEGGAFNVNTFEPNSENDEMLLEFRKKLIADKGAWIEQVNISGDWESYFPMVTNLLMSKSKEYSIYVLEAGWAMTLYSQGLLYPLSDSSVKLNNRVEVAGQKGAWNKMMEDLFTINGKTYAASPGLGGFSWQNNYLFFNKRLFREAGLDPDLPYNMQRDGTWTWDNFLNVCKQLTRDINNDGVTDIYALPIDDMREIMYGFVYSNNGSFVTIDAQGKYHNNMNSPEFLEAIAFIQRLVNEGVVKDRQNAEGDYEWGWNWSEFFDGRVAMVFDPEWRQGELPGMTDDVGIVLAPKGPRASNYRISSTEVVYAIPSYFTKAEVDVILEAFDLWNTPMDTDWKQGYYWAYRDRRAVDETMQLAKEVGVYRDFSIIPGYPAEQILVDGGRWWQMGTPAQIVESWAPVVQAAINDANR